MATLMIGYDLNKTGKDYTGLIAEIRAQFKTYWHNLDSTWLVVTDLTPAQVRDLLAPHLDADDELLVSKISPPAAWRGFNEAASKWLMDNLN
jgi:hypothetical protein